jgi:hypothetical protein
MMRTMRSLLAAGILVATVASLSSSSVASAAPKKYHYSLVAVRPDPKVKADLVPVVKARVEAQVKKAFEEHPQLSVKTDGAPDPKTKADAYRAFLKSKGLTGAYAVTVDITEATEEVVPVEGKPNTQRLNVHIALHMLGEEIPAMTMGFSGDGHATIKQEIGMKLRDSDRNYSWDQCAQLAVDDAIKESLRQLALPPKAKK